MAEQKPLVSASDIVQPANETLQTSGFDPVNAALETQEQIDRTQREQQERINRGEIDVRTLTGAQPATITGQSTWGGFVLLQREKQR